MTAARRATCRASARQRRARRCAAVARGRRGPIRGLQHEGDAAGWPEGGPEGGPEGEEPEGVPDGDVPEVVPVEEAAGARGGAEAMMQGRVRAGSAQMLLNLQP